MSFEQNKTMVATKTNKRKYSAYAPKLIFIDFLCPNLSKENSVCYNKTYFG